MNYKQLIYSLDKKITITNIKNGKFEQNIDIEKIKKRTDENHIDCLQYGEKNYHFKFESVKSKPYFVYYKGNINLLNKPILSIVGPRKMSNYANKVLEKLFSFLKKYDCVTISGLAEGVDSCCHNLSIKNNIPTIAVLGGGIGRFLQSNKRKKIENIIENGGLILSEFKLKQEPTNYTFPQRNRIIAGLSRVLFVPEAGESSGTLITVNNALDMRIPIFSTSNNFFEKNSIGINRLIGEKKVSLVFDFEKFLGQYFPKKVKKTSDTISSNDFNNEFSDIQIKILKIITGNYETSLEKIQEKLSIDAKELFTEISLLEIEGKIYQSSPGKYKII